MAELRYAKPDILDAIPHDRHTVIEASAGTGKTYTLEHLLVDLLLTEDVEIDEILVVTFTERATSELRMRVRDLLSKLDRLDQDEADPAGPRWTLDKAARDKLDRALRKFDLAPVHTIHAFCKGVLTENAFAGGRLLEQELVDGKRLFGEVLRRTIRTVFACREPYRTLLAWWMARHRVGDLEGNLYQAVRADVRILEADAPSTYVSQVQAARAFLLDPRNLDRLESGVHDFRKLEDGKKLHPATRRAYLDRFAFLRSLAHRNADTVDLFLSGSELRKYVGEHFRTNREKLDFGKWSDDHARVIRAVETFDRLKPVTLAAFRDEAAKAFVHEKAVRGLYDFGDMLERVHEALEGENGPAIAEALRSRYRFALIDEFQDTDRVQWEIFRRIFFENAGRHRLYTVGDPKQAIYGFRGADVRTYILARKAIVAAGGKRLPLIKNYRSTERMIAAVNALLREKDRDAFFTGSHIRYEEPVECGRPERRAVAAAGEDVKPLCLLRLEPGDGKGQERLGRTIAATIRNLVENQELRFGDEELRPIGYGDIHVLARKNWECDRMGEFLREAGVPFAFYRKDGLFQTDEAHDIRDLLRAIDDPGDRSNRQKAWVTPFFGVPLAEVERFGELEPDHPFARRLFEWRDAARRRDFETLFPRILDESGVLRRELFLRESERKLTNYLHIFEVLLEEAARYRQDLAGLIATLGTFIREEAEPAGRESTQQRLETDRLSVQVMSIHKAKGLEAPVVFLYGGYGTGRPDRLHVFHHDDDLEARRVMVAGSLDEATRARRDRDETEEEQRLLYVAMTRAAARLYLPWIDPKALHALNGSYCILNDRLDTFARDPANAAHFEEVMVPASSGAPERAGPEAPPEPAWTPPADLLEESDPPIDFADLAKRHAAFVVSSYSRMKRAAHGDRAPSLEIADEGGREPGEDEPAAAPAGVAEEVLPGGTAIGSFMHEVLEFVDLPALRGAPPEDWIARPDVDALLRAKMLRHDIDARYLPQAGRLAHVALTADLKLGDVLLAGGIASLDPTRVRREMEFLYPIPEADHPGLGASAPEGGITVERGFLRGFVDLVFEHDRRIYFADWKTDILPDYDAATLEEYVKQNYAIQATVYAVAMARWLGLRDASDTDARFGGILYCFLRGMEAPGSGTEGVHFRRPSWAQLEGYVRELREFSRYRESRHGA